MTQAELRSAFAERFRTEPSRAAQQLLLIRSLAPFTLAEHLACTAAALFATEMECARLLRNYGEDGGTHAERYWQLSAKNDRRIAWLRGKLGPDWRELLA